MGHLCSCARGQRTSYTGKSPEWLVAPVRRSPSTAKQRPTAGIFYMTSSSPLPAENGARVALNGDDGSNTSLGESGISSKGSSYLDDSHTLTSLSAPSSPLMTRRKPPPKPPRSQHSFLSSPSTSRAGGGGVQCRRTPSVRSAGVASLRSALAADVTTALDASVTGPEPAATRQFADDRLYKAWRVAGHVKKFLSHVVEAAPLWASLRRRGVVSGDSDAAVGGCPDGEARCELLLELVTRQGGDEFRALSDALRDLGDHDDLADLLHVLDVLAKAFLYSASDACGGQTNNNNDDNDDKNDDNDNREMCSSCRLNNSDTDGGGGSGGGEDGDILNDFDSFDIDISYVDSETGQTRTLDDVVALKQKRQKLQTECGACDPLPQTAHIVPVIVVALYNQCLRCNRRIDTIVDVIRNYTCVAELSIVKSHIGEADLSRVSEALQHNRGLSKLDVRLNNIGDAGAACLAESLRRNASIRRLNVTSTGLAGSSYSRLLLGVSRSQSLTELNISFNELPADGCRVVSEHLASNAPLRQLRMRHNNVTTAGACSIFLALRRNSRLDTLDISCNALGDVSMTVLSEVLLCNRTLRDLNLESCGVTADGCGPLGRALKTNTMLRRLDVSMNRVGDAGADALADGLRYNQALRVLAMNMCDVGNTGFLTLLAALRHNNSMETLKVCYNRVGHIDREGVEWRSLGSEQCRGGRMLPSIEVLYANLCRTLQLNNDLKVLLWGNRLEELAEEALTTAAARTAPGPRGANETIPECVASP